MKFPRLFTQKAAQVLPAASTNPGRALFVGIYNLVRNAVAEYKNVIAAAEATKHPVLYRALNKIGLTVQAVSWYVEDDPDATENEKAGNAEFKKSLTKVLRRPNAGMTGTQLRYWYAVSWANFGEASFKVIVDGGKVTGIYPLEKKSLKITLDAYGNDKEFVYGKGSNPERIPALEIVDKDAKGFPSKAFAFRIRKMTVDASVNPDHSNTPLNAAGNLAKLYEQLLERALDVTDNQPNTRWLVTADPETTDAQADAIKEKTDEMRPGGNASGSVLFIAGANVKINELKNDLSDIHSKVPLDDTARTIFSLFGIPAALANINSADGSKFASNYAESRLTFFEDVIDPDYLSPCEEGLTIALCRVGFRIRFDRDSIPAIKRARAEVAKIYNDVAFIDDNEKREVTGWPKRDTTPNVTNDNETRSAGQSD